MQRELESVYTTFVNLDRNYKKSNKTKEEYVRGKFGGDITVGSMIILDYLSGLDLESTSDIEKLSTIRDIFKVIKEHEKSLNALPHLNFLHLGNELDYTKLLDVAEQRGAGIKYVTTEELQKKGHTHYLITEKRVEVVPILEAKELYVFSAQMASYAESLLGKKALVGSRYKVEFGGTLVKEGAD